MTMYTLPFSYSNSYLFQQNFSLVFHDEKVDEKIDTVLSSGYNKDWIKSNLQYQIIKIKRQKGILEKGSILATHLYLEQ